MKNRPRSVLKRSIAAMVLWLPFGVLMEPAIAQVPFEAPPVSAPGNRESGSSRSDTCATTLNEAGLTAVIPETNVGLTTKALPVFFAYVPANNAEWVEFRLFDEETGAEMYVGQVALPVATDAEYRYAPSLVSLSIPEEEAAIALEAGKRYLWALMLVCNGENRAEDIVVTGVVQRPEATYFESLEPSIQDQLSSVSQLAPADQLMVYGEAGLWHDLLEVLASLATSDPTAYQNDWSTLLAAQGLGAIANAPIVFTKIDPL